MAFRRYEWIENAIGEQSWRVGPGQRCGQHAFKGEIIIVFEKQRQPHHPPIQDVIRNTRHP